MIIADISGSTRIYDQYGDAIVRHDISTCLELLADVASGYGGRTVKTSGDEIMCVFNNPVKAGAAAIKM